MGIRNEYISYCPSTFTYDNVQGTVNDIESDANGDLDDSNGDGNVVLEHDKQFMKEYNNSSK
eukprot:10921704-Ditylum_brightwellii.AAC.1